MEDAEVLLVLALVILATQKPRRTATPPTASQLQQQQQGGGWIDGAIAIGGSLLDAWTRSNANQTPATASEANGVWVDDPPELDY